MAESPISKCKSCGLEGHLRKSSKLCPNHNMTPESTEIVPNPSVNTKSTPICAACGGTGHRRSSHTDCPRNRVNLASETLPSNGTNHDPVDKKAKVQNSAATPSSVSQLETKPASTTAPDSDSASTPVTALTNVKCATCGENGHRRMSHRDCPKNPQNIASN
ncbi:hypothetical protein BCR41DRAFT_55612 [Lobosporangium transversale]|uniref:CCHC-type domain-containing protein n=1 Tax=Lobosporangium transversale TaxID=64571 RepID=A0A1Y2GNR6_9FUNG|nr:hypothetical protein BCR41DRAFT_55612 [Lobosporangium transversale]ORZ16760.1 hypothetical protein BCR41DRAFT_55612 [Lobosporangium transversale]|eukprot:XP_021881695.1 hypothetical protein BCR41DRAFT_55612 [Lobosporangium transversale]